MPSFSHHLWSKIDLEEGQSLSTCQRCGIMVQHHSQRGPNVTGVRYMQGKRLKAREKLPLCVDGARLKMPARHLWNELGDAPPSPTGAKCRRVVCTRCGMEIEVIRSVKCPAQRVSGRFWRRHRMRETDPWSHGDVPVCLELCEDELGVQVKKHWDKTPIKELAKMFGVSVDTIRTRAARWGLKSKYTAGGSKPWTEEEDAFLAWNIEKMNAMLIAKELKRTYGSIIRRAVKLGMIENGVPRGYETLEQASRRTGYNPDQLRLIIRSSSRGKGKGVKSKKVQPHVLERAPHIDRRVYNIESIDQAVVDWQKLEVFHAACVRLEIHSQVLRKALAELGVVKPESKKRQMWMVPTDKLEEAAKLVSSYISPTEYARERGMNVSTVLRRLRKAGYSKPGGDEGRRKWSLPKEVLDNAFKDFPVEEKYVTRRKVSA